MHDPMTVAFELRYPWRAYPKEQRTTEFRRSYRRAFIVIWHVDPERDGSDDSCDWSGRRRPLNARERALSDALNDLFHTLGNAPYYPDRKLYGSNPHGESPDDWGVVQRAERAMWAWRRRGWLHPRWHVWHWRVQIVPLQQFKRWAFSRCERCGGRFGFDESPISGSWYGTGPRWFRGEDHLRHQSCDAKVGDF